MDKTEVIRAARRLPVQSRRDIIAALEKTIERDETATAAENRLYVLINLASTALGVTDYNPRRKNNGDAYVRNLCAFQMRFGDGYTLAQIGRAMGRHTSSVIEMSRRGHDMRAGFYGAEIQAQFESFEKAVQYYDKEND